MGIIELLLIGIGLSMDAFAVSVCKGLSVQKVRAKHVLTAAIYFGGFQALMPLIGYYLGSYFRSYIESYDHWIAFILLAVIGAKMIKGAFGDGEDSKNDSFSFKTMTVLAIATSIDALAVGVSFAMVGDVNIWLAIILIFATTFILSGIGIYIGNIFGSKYKSRAEIVGGIILILIGFKILFQHLGLISF